MIGNGVSVSAGVPAYCLVSPAKVCLSVPQMPDISIRSSSAPSASAGRGNSCTSYRPGATSTAARTRSDIADQEVADPLDQRLTGVGPAVLVALAGQLQVLHRTVQLAERADDLVRLADRDVGVHLPVHHQQRDV